MVTDTARKKREKEILRTIEVERRRVGQDLHDVVGQDLAGVAFLCKVLQQKLAGKAPEEASDAERITRLVNESIAHTRALVKGLHPVEIDKTGLPGALGQLAANTEQLFGISCKVQRDEGVTVKDREVSEHLYHIAREALTNAITHGRADNVIITLARRKGDIVLRVTDDGVGFAKTRTKSEGMGLRIMNFRARMIGASLETRRRSGGGTVVTCSLGKQKEKATAKAERDHGQQ